MLKYFQGCILHPRDVYLEALLAGLLATQVIQCIAPLWLVMLT
jgi:hypothetical protein